jgi:hypothetical protein
MVLKVLLVLIENQQLSLLFHVDDHVDIGQHQLLTKDQNLDYRIIEFCILYFWYSTNIFFL